MLAKKSVVIAVIMALILVVPTACSGAKFQLSSPEITPAKVGTGDNVTITADVANVGKVEGTYTATLTIDGAPVYTEYVTLPVGGTQKVAFKVVKDSVGVYEVGIGKLKGTLQVVKPAEFKLSSLVVIPNEVILGDQITATVEVSNIGDLSGNYTCTLMIDGVTAGKKEVMLNGGSKEAVTFAFTPKRGAHQVTVSNLTQNIMVMKSAEFTLSSMLISPDEVVPGSNVTVSTIVANTGDIKGDHTVTLFFNGTRETQDVTLAGGENKTVSFTVMAQNFGIYNVKFNIQQTGTLAVTPPAPVGYKGYADRKNGFFIAYPEEWKQEKRTATNLFVSFNDAETSFTVGKETSFLYASAREFVSQNLRLAEAVHFSIVQGYLNRRCNYKWSFGS